MTLTPAARIRGRLRVPGDKSISHRYAILAALADGRSSFDGFAPGADCQSPLACLARLGVEVTSDRSGAVWILGRGLGSFRRPSDALDAGNSGTTLRLLMGGVAGHPFSCRFVGDASLSRRPMRRVIEPLERMGARVEATVLCAAPAWLVRSAVKYSQWGIVLIHANPRLRRVVRTLTSPVAGET